MRNTYPSDRSREQCVSIHALWEQAKKKTMPRAVDLYGVFLRCCVCIEKRLPMANVPG